MTKPLIVFFNYEKLLWFSCKVSRSKWYNWEPNNKSGYKTKNCTCQANFW